MARVSVIDAPSNLGLRPPAPGVVPGVYKLAGGHAWPCMTMTIYGKRAHQLGKFEAVIATHCRQ